MSSSNRETLAGVLLSCSIILNSLYWIIQRNSLASSKDTSFLSSPSPFLANLPAGTSSSRVGFASLASSATSFGFHLAFAGRTHRLGAAKMWPLQVTPLSPIILVTLAESELVSVALFFLSLDF